MLELHILQGPDRGKRFVLPEGEPQMIGRSSESLPITDKSVSRRHAELTPDDGRWFLRDLESANGTFVNGQKIGDRVALSPGDQVRCGSTLIAFAHRGDPEKASPVQVIDPDMFDVTVEGRVNPNEESMILGQPDPVKAATHHLRILYDITALAATTIKRDELLNRIMDLVFDEFGPDRGFVLLYDEHLGPGAPMQPAVVRYKVRPKTVEEGHIPVSRTIIQHALTAAEGVLSTNAMNDQRFRSGDSVHSYGIRSAICVPIRTAQTVYGVFHIDSSIANFTFTQPQLRLMSAIGQHTGLVLQSSRLVSSVMRTERLAAMGEVVASLSHSIKNILQALRGGADAVEMALNRGDLKLAREGWPILARNLDRIYALTLNMLTYSKPRQMEVELTAIKPLLEEVGTLVQPGAQRKKIALIVDVADDMPPMPMDPNAIHQALMNLLSNAVEAAPEKTGRVTLRAVYDAPKREGLISVSDNGPGIEPERHEKVFEAFTSSSKGQRGTGLGLAVTRKIVQEHGGRIELKSERGQGATFIITLPSDRHAGDPSETRLPRPMPRPREETF